VEFDKPLLQQEAYSRGNDEHSSVRNPIFPDTSVSCLLPYLSRKKDHEQRHLIFEVRLGLVGFPVCLVGQFSKQNNHISMLLIQNLKSAIFGLSGKPRLPHTSLMGIHSPKSE
jgi:hypothetical protein